MADASKLREERAARRAKALELLRAGNDPEHVAKLLMVNPTTVKKWRSEQRRASRAAQGSLFQ